MASYLYGHTLILSGKQGYGLLLLKFRPTFHFACESSAVDIVLVIRITAECLDLCLRDFDLNRL